MSRDEREFWFRIACLVVFLVFFIWVIFSVEKINADPCAACERAGRVCTPQQVFAVGQESIDWGDIVESGNDT